MMKNSKFALVFENVSKTYKKAGFIGAEKKVALNDVSFYVKKGEIVGLLGLNGAGKTTIIKSIFSIIKVDCGNIRVLDSHPLNEKVRRYLGYIPELPYFPPQLTARQILYYYAFLSGMPTKTIESASNVILERVGLKERKNSKCAEFSKGMLQRLAFAQALIHNPEFVIMDEPVSGLDPIAVRDLRNLIADLNKKGTTFFFSSHSISELEKLCFTVLIIKNGKIVEIVDKQRWEAGKDTLEEIFVEAVKNEAQD